MTPAVGHQLIGGVRSDAGSVLFRSLDAFTGEPLPRAYLEATVQEVDAAAFAAMKAFPADRKSVV